MAVIVPTARPLTITWLRRSEVGLSSTGFIRTEGSIPAASAWVTCARPISSPSDVANEFSAMFCALNGATFSPSCLKILQSAQQSVDLPTEEPVP